MVCGMTPIAVDIHGGYDEKNDKNEMFIEGFGRLALQQSNIGVKNHHVP